MLQGQASGSVSVTSMRGGSRHPGIVVGVGNGVNFTMVRYYVNGNGVSLTVVR